MATMPPEDPMTVPPEPSPRPLPWPVRWLLQAFAVLCLVMGAIGVVVPGLPTTVFILMAAWAAARSSPRLYRWLWNQRLFGPLLRNWAQGGKVSRRAKWSAALMMSLSAVVLLLTVSRPWIVAVAIGSMACVLAWLWRRPEPS
ncbi:YbaN family protein [Acidovorax sp. FJL06]|uniref:YbaN family protein n=1 Tax=Acidovorax sp. FJL06 TaxID=2153365 RepID=UPI0018F3F3EA